MIGEPLSLSARVDIYFIADGLIRCKLWEQSVIPLLSGLTIIYRLLCQGEARFAHFRRMEGCVVCRWRRPQCHYHPKCSSWFSSLIDSSDTLHPAVQVLLAGPPGCKRGIQHSFRNMLWYPAPYYYALLYSILWCLNLCAGRIGWIILMPLSLELRLENLLYEIRGACWLSSP